MLFSSTDPLGSDCYFQFSDNDGVTITNRPNVDNNCDGLTAKQQSTSGTFLPLYNYVLLFARLDFKMLAILIDISGLDAKIFS